MERAVTVYPLDLFVAQNLDEMSQFSALKMRDGLRALIDEYNERVEAVEADKFLMMKPPGAAKRADKRQSSSAGVTLPKR